MKKILFALFAAMLVFSGCNKSEQFKVTLNIDNADKQTVYLSKTVDGQEIIVDSAVFSGKNAVLTAPNDDPQTAYYIKFDLKERCGDFAFFTENQNTTISGDLEEYPNWIVKGCPIMDEWAVYREMLLPIEEKMMAVYNESMEAVMAGDTVKATELFGQVETMMDEYNDIRLDYYKKHGDSYLTHFMLDQEKEGLELAEIKEIASGFTTESMYSKNVKEYVKQFERVEIGQPFMDFTLKTADGNDVNLAEVIENNKVTLIDFWASWCRPCRMENPFVKAAYEKYHAKGLEIVGISVDGDEAAWMKAVETDGLPWTHVRDIDNNVSADYLVKYIPSNFLFDQNGLIIAKNLRGEDLEAKLAEVL